MVEYSPKDKITVLCDRERLFLLLAVDKKSEIEIHEKNQSHHDSSFVIIIEGTIRG